MDPRKKPAGVDEYLSDLSMADRAALSLRAQIRTAAPEAEETISYQIPAYLYHGALVFFAAQSKHLSLYAISLDLLKRFREDLEPYELTGHTIHFTPSNPLPAALVRKLIRGRVKENEERERREGLAIES